MRRDDDSAASIGIATSHTAANDDTPPELMAMAVTRVAMRQRRQRVRALIVAGFGSDSKKSGSRDQPAKHATSMAPGAPRNAT